MPAQALTAASTRRWRGGGGFSAIALKPRRFDFERGTLTIAESYQRIDGQDVLTDPKTPRSKRVLAMPRFYAEEMEVYVSANDFGPDERIFPVTKHFLARGFSAMRGEEEPSDVEREDALIFGMSRR